jgi:DNA-binding NtrC family response regulator
VERGEFREDLYYRLRVVEIAVPPLRERPGDIPALAAHLVRKVSLAAERPVPLLAPEAMDVLMSHTWPGNVRELENCLTRAVVLATGDVIRPEHLELAPREDAGELGTLDTAEREHVTRVLTATQGHKSNAAEILGISRPRLDRLIEKYQLGNLVRARRAGDETDTRRDEP